MGGPAGGTGPATVPGAMPGAMATGLTSVKLAVDALQKALPSLPMGSDLHTAVLNSLSGLTKHMDDAGMPPVGNEDVVQQLVALARQNAQGGNPLAAMMPGGGAPPPGGGAPPPLPMGA
jgi:hypothetical protein